MATVPDRRSAPVPVPRVSFASPVDRALIHRRHPDEAFLTDTVPNGPDGFVAAALLPPAHPHWTGHTGPSRHRDPMLLLECARQAETHAAHTVYGVEPDARFVLRNWSAEFTRGVPPAATGPTELLLTGVTRNPRLVRDRLRGLDYDLGLWVAGDPVGRIRMTVGYVSAAAYPVLRSRKHHGAPPSSADPVPVTGRPVDPGRVGRVRPTDVVLLDVAGGTRTVTARLRVPAENPSLFDHAQDHVPAMVLVEAARQLAALATRHWGGPGPDRTAMTAMTASFDDYAELTGPVELTATPGAAVAADGRSVEVAFRQAGADIARALIVLAVPAGETGHRSERSTGWHGPRS